MPYMIGSNKKINRSRVHLASAFSVQKNGTSVARSDMSSGTKKDATHFFVLGLEPTQFLH